MLSDPIYLVSPIASLTATATGVIPLALVPSSALATKRVHVESTGTYTLSISRSESKENAPYVTNRTVQRLDLTKIDSLGKKVTASCYVVIAAPLSNDFPVADVIDLVQQTCLFAAFGASDDSGTSVSKANGVTHLGRILEGEG